jgi:hypothetical protein
MFDVKIYILHIELTTSIYEGLKCFLAAQSHRDNELLDMIILEEIANSR